MLERPVLRIVNGTASDLTRLHGPERQSVRAGSQKVCQSCKEIKSRRKIGPSGLCSGCQNPWDPGIDVQTANGNWVIRSREDYDRYLNSSHWHDVKHQYWGDKRFKSASCHVCGGAPAELYHHRYDQIGQERLEDLVAVCADCHRVTLRVQYLHRDMSLWKALLKFKRLVENHGYYTASSQYS